MKTLLFALVYLALSGPGKTFHSQEEALVLAFGKAEVQRTPHYWTKVERTALGELAGTKKVGGTHAKFQAKTKQGKVVAGRSVWFDTRMVRSKPQTIMLIIDAEQRVEKLVVCSFDEPLDYKPVARWYEQFEGRQLNDELQLKKGIHGVSGATLTSRATTAAVREVLAAHATAHPVVIKKATARKK
ncbi:MAG: FMN-binding protein [Planctomycetota bacterium]|nr:FMN-binding protein [Planctomycetota bacterium]MDA1113543.1 FMN-binding protein [Planctomycetota bacterium]